MCLRDRPFIIATEAHLGVKVADEYLFLIVASPSGPYYPEGLNPVKIYVETVSYTHLAGLAVGSLGGILFERMGESRRPHYQI